MYSLPIALQNSDDAGLHSLCQVLGDVGLSGQHCHLYSGWSGDCTASLLRGGGLGLDVHGGTLHWHHGDTVCSRLI